MKRVAILVTLFFIQTNSSLFSYDNLLFKPLTANHLESRIGFYYQPTNEKVRLDIGHSLDMLDILNYKLPHKDSKLNIRLGGDFFILSRLRSEGNMKFPVETSDFYFGLNCSGKFSGDCDCLINKLSYRIRVGHISAHLVDGYTKDYVFLQEPFVYSREFVDLVIAINTKYFRPYIGTTAVFHTIPSDANTIIPQIGIDFDYPIFLYKVNIIGGYDFKINGNTEQANVGCNSIQLGLLFNLSKNIGISANYYYYNGNSIHGMFYDTKEKYNGFGIQINY